MNLTLHYQWTGVTIEKTQSILLKQKIRQEEREREREREGEL